MSPLLGRLQTPGGNTCHLIFSKLRENSCFVVRTFFVRDNPKGSVSSGSQPVIMILRLTVNNFFLFYSAFHI